MLKRLLRLAGLVMLAATIVWLTREHLLPTPKVDDEPKPHYRSTPPPPQHPDDLTEVKGIGPVYAGRLNEAGIKTFRGLAGTDVVATAAAIEVAEDTVADWVEQAKAKLH